MEDRLHSEIQGEELDFTIKSHGEPKDVQLQVQNLAVDQSYNVLLQIRLREYECPTDVDDWAEDIKFLYATNFLRDSKELGNRLLSGVEVMGLNRHDIQIHFTVHRTSLSGIWEAVNRFSNVISVYHNGHFQTTKRLYREIDENSGENTDIPMEVATDLLEEDPDWNIIQAHNYLRDYANWKSNSVDWSNNPELGA